MTKFLHDVKESILFSDNLTDLCCSTKAEPVCEGICPGACRNKQHCRLFENSILSKAGHAWFCSQISAHLHGSSAASASQPYVLLW